jgi:hypothetical protein
VNAKKLAIWVAVLFSILWSEYRGQGAENKTSPWPASVEQALARAGKNRPELEKALRATAAEQRKGMAFLIANMPEHDLQSLRADFLRENVELADRARKETPWGRRIPEAVFLNDVLPYANVDEERHPWRKQLAELCRPLVKDCKSPAEAAQRINATIFAKLKVRFSTQRKKPNQSPRETIESGMASCTGLSILLIDACRSVGVPARLVGTPLWVNQRGNHTWVEIWDGDWHFTGAAEPDPKGLDRGWFVGDASQAIADSPVHAIFAVSFQRTRLTFPLVWALERKEVFAENVTARYARPKPIARDRARVLIRVWRAGRKQRLAVPVTVVDRRDAGKVWRGEAHGERADPNDILVFELPAGRDYLVHLEKPVHLERSLRTKGGQEHVLEIEVPGSKRKAPEFSKDQRGRIEKAAGEFFAADAARRARWRFDVRLDELLAGHEEEVRRLVWKGYQSAAIHGELKKDFDKHQVRYGQHLSPYTVKKVGQRPADGWPLFIAMHGGGGAPKEVNDSQWMIMQIYYRDQFAVTGYQYLALRAPNDSWNGFYSDYVPPLVANLIRQLVLLGDVDPNKVYLMGYSHGGYGAFFIGPKIPDRFAAIHSSAAAPTGGTISPRTLRNTRFTYMIGEKDDAHGRRQYCEAFNELVQKLRRESPDDYPVVLELKKGFGHGGLPDRDKIKEMYAFTRDPVPRRVSWDLTDTVVRDFCWLSVPKPRAGQRIDAAIDGNMVQITTQHVKDFVLHLDGRLVDYGRPVKVVVDGKSQVHKLRPGLLTLCRSIVERGDPDLAFACRMELTGGRE